MRLAIRIPLPGASMTKTDLSHFLWDRSRIGTVRRSTTSMSFAWKQSVRGRGFNQLEGNVAFAKQL